MNVMILLIAAVAVLVLMIIGYFILRKMVQNGRVTERAGMALLAFMVVFVLCAAAFAFLFFLKSVPVSGKLFGGKSQSVQMEYDLSEEIVGKWATAYVNGEHTISTVGFKFLEDGTFMQSYHEFMDSAYFPELFGEESTGWESAPMGVPRIFGTYEIKDSDTVILHCTHGDYEQVFDEIVELNITILSDDKIEFAFYGTSLIGSDATFTYSKNYDYFSDFETLCDTLRIEH